MRNGSAGLIEFYEIDCGVKTLRWPMNVILNNRMRPEYFKDETNTFYHDHENINDVKKEETKALPPQDETFDLPPKHYEKIICEVLFQLFFLGKNVLIHGDEGDNRVGSIVAGLLR